MAEDTVSEIIIRCAYFGEFVADLKNTDNMLDLESNKKAFDEYLSGLPESLRPAAIGAFTAAYVKTIRPSV